MSTPTSPTNTSSEQPRSPDGAGESLETRLDRIDARLDRLERSIGRVTELMDQVPLLVGGFTDVADDAIGDDGADIDARLHKLVRVADKVTHPEVLEGLEQLAERGDQLQKLVEITDALPGGVAMLVDIFDDLVERSVEEGIDIIEVSQQLSMAATKFARFVKGPEFQAVLDAGVLDPEAVQMVGRAGDALAEISVEKNEQTGMFGLLGAMRDDDVRRAIGFAVAFARRFGADLDTTSPRKLPE